MVDFLGLLGEILTSSPEKRVQRWEIPLSPSSSSSSSSFSGEEEEQPQQEGDDRGDHDKETEGEEDPKKTEFSSLAKKIKTRDGEGKEKEEVLHHEQKEKSERGEDGVEGSWCLCVESERDEEEEERPEDTEEKEEGAKTKKRNDREEKHSIRLSSLGGERLSVIAKV